jgi:hypothetical protein
MGRRGRRRGRLINATVFGSVYINILLCNDIAMIYEYITEYEDGILFGVVSLTALECCEVWDGLSGRNISRDT